MIILGIDPGNSGGIVALNEDGSIRDKMSFSTIDDPAYKSKKKLLNYDKLLNFLDLNHWDEFVTYIEVVGAMPGQGVTSMFTFGKGYGLVLGVLLSYNSRIEYVRPKQWQKKVLSITDLDNKSNSVQTCLGRWPDETWLNTETRHNKKSKPHDGLCDAANIAYYGYLKEIK